MAGQLGGSNGKVAADTENALNELGYLRASGPLNGEQELSYSVTERLRELRLLRRYPWGADRADGCLGTT